MTRLLIFLAVVFAIGYLANRGLMRLQSKLRDLMSEPEARRSKQGSALVACSACGVHLPRSRALELPGDFLEVSGSEAPRFYCSEACRREAASMPDAIRSKSA